MRKSQIGVLVALLALPLVGCVRLGQRGDVDVQVDSEGATVTLTLTEAEVQGAVEDALPLLNPPVVENPQADLQSGVIVLSGDVVRRDGSTVPGSITLQPGVENDHLTLTVTNADLSGIDATDTYIDRLNTAIADGLARAIARKRTDAHVTAVTVSDDTLTITVRVPRAN